MLFGAMCLYPAAEQNVIGAKSFYPTAEQNVLRTIYFIPVTILTICIFIIPINISKLRFSQQ